MYNGDKQIISTVTSSTGYSGVAM